MNQQKIVHTITVICDQGCAHTRMLIQALEAGAAIQETTDLDEAERQAVLAELKSIMLIYDQRK